MFLIPYEASEVDDAPCLQGRALFLSENKAKKQRFPILLLDFHCLLFVLSDFARNFQNHLGIILTSFTVLIKSSSLTNSIGISGFCSEKSLSRLMFSIEFIEDDKIIFIFLNLRNQGQRGKERSFAMPKSNENTQDF